MSLIFLLERVSTQQLQISFKFWIYLQSWIEIMIKRWHWRWECRIFFQKIKTYSMLSQFWNKNVERMRLSNKFSNWKIKTWHTNCTFTFLVISVVRKMTTFIGLQREHLAAAESLFVCRWRREENILVRINPLPGDAQDSYNM